MYQDRPRVDFITVPAFYYLGRRLILQDAILAIVAQHADAPTFERLHAIARAAQDGTETAPPLFGADGRA
jgi:hypothetical protein